MGLCWLSSVNNDIGPSDQKFLINLFRFRRSFCVCAFGKIHFNRFDPTGAYPRERIYYERGHHSSDMFADSAIRFLTHRDPDRPFLCYVSFTAPHDPRDTHQRYHDMYDANNIALPPNFMPEHPFDNGELRIRDEGLAPWPRPPAEIRQHIADYYAMLTHADAQIGRVLDTLRETGQDGNTIIVFAGDNGLALGQHGLMGKQNMYEHSLRVPLIFAGPDVPRGQRRDAYCYLLDIYPTLCSLLGLAAPDTVEGISLTPSMANPAEGIRETLLFAYRGIQRAVKDRHHKLIEYVVNGRRTTQLFDLRQDPWELDNLAADPSSAGAITRLSRELRRWQSDWDDDQQGFWEAYETASPAPAATERSQP